MNYDVIVIGSGPAGLEAARKTAAAGKNTAVVTATPPGGRATVGSLLPSKGWLYHAHHAGKTTSEDIPAAAARVRTTVSDRVAWTRSALSEAGVTVIAGKAMLTGSNSVTVEPRDAESGQAKAQVLTATAVVIAAGSEPIFFPGVKPDGSRIIAPRHTQHLSELPGSLVMVGGGVTGVEYSSVFARMGTSVTMLSYDPLLPRSDREYVGRLQDTLRTLGIEIETGVAVEQVENTGEGVRVTRRGGGTVEADYAFIATGRAGDLTFFGEGAPEPARTPDERFLAVDEMGRTSVPGLFACGDITGAPLTANKAVLQGRRVAEAILSEAVQSDGSGAPRSARQAPREGAEWVIEAVYTEPQLAQIGPVLELAERSDVKVVRKSYASSMLSQVHGSAGGEVKIWTDSSGVILGAAAFGEAASEVLAPVQVAMQNGNSLSELESVPFAYPSISEVVTF
ncbi:MAG: FAD-dependent oxidoreductase [Alkalispirochaeta sp.]